MKFLEIFTDGACSGNPGESGIGVVIKENGKTLKSISKAMGHGTNNIAEYTALVYALQEALILKADRVLVNTDSELLMHQVKGSYKVKHPNLKSLHEQVKHLWGGFKDIDIQHIPREKNSEADKLATEPIKKEQAKVVAPLFNSGEESPSSEG